MRHTTKFTIGAVGTAVLLGGLTTGVAFADDDDDYREACSQAVAADYDDDREDCDDDSGQDVLQPVLDVERASSGRIEVEAGVEHATPGQSWRLEIWQNGRQRVTTTVTADAEGDAEIQRLLKNRRGADRIQLRASGADGQELTTQVKFKAADRAPQRGNGGDYPNSSRPS